MTVYFVKEKETKNTIRFKENAEEPVIGTLYVPKQTLAEIKYKDGDTLIVEFKVAE